MHPLDEIQHDLRELRAKTFRAQAAAFKERAKKLKGAARTALLNKAAVELARAESHETAATLIEVLRPELERG